MNDIDLINQEHPENIYAKNNKGEVVFINDVESGRKGYFCLGCDREMQAVKFKIERFKSYFRHDYEYAKHEQKCSYSSETLRHKLAKEELYLCKQIKVPKVLKYHPTEHNAPAIILKHEEFILANRVELEMPFFENEFGEIAFGRNLENNERHLLIQPDVAFFDENNMPILLIEIVATHKVTDDKIAKIRRLGINTMQITIPKDSPAAIAESLKSTTRAKWIFHNEEAKSDYLQLSQSGSETISHFDAEQRKLLGETFSCRQAEIRQLISGIRKCLQSERYLGARELLSVENARITRLTVEQNEELRRFENTYTEKFRGKFESEKARITGEKGIEGELFERDRVRRKNLVSRYNRKREYLETEKSNFEREERDFETEQNRFRIEFKRVTDNIRKEEDFVRRLEIEIEGIRREYDLLESVFKRKLAIATTDLKYRVEEEGRAINEIIERRKQLPEEFANKEEYSIRDFGTEEKRLEEEITRNETQLRDEFEIRNKKIWASIEARDIEGDNDGAKAIRDVIHGREYLCAIINKQEPYKRIKSAYESIRNGSYKPIMERYNR